MWTNTNTKPICNAPISPSEITGIRGARGDCYWEWSAYAMEKSSRLRLRLNVTIHTSCSTTVKRQLKDKSFQIFGALTENALSTMTRESKLRACSRCVVSLVTNAVYGSVLWHCMFSQLGIQLWGQCILYHLQLPETCRREASCSYQGARPQCRAQPSWTCLEASSHEQIVLASARTKGVLPCCRRHQLRRTTDVVSTLIARRTLSGRTFPVSISHHPSTFRRQLKTCLITSSSSCDEH